MSHFTITFVLLWADCSFLPALHNSNSPRLFTYISWEQGTAAGAILELDDSEYSVFADSPFKNKGQIPVSTLHLALSAAVRQTSDGRLSQQINDALDGAALDGGMYLMFTYIFSSLICTFQP